MLSLIWKTRLTQIAPLKSNVPCLIESISKSAKGVGKPGQGERTPRMLSFVFSKRPAIGSLYNEHCQKITFNRITPPQ